MAHSRSRTATLPAAPHLSLAGFAAVGALVSASLAALCWLGLLNAVIGCNHAFIAFFTAADPGSTAALRDAVLASLPFGAATGAAAAWLCNRIVRVR